MKIQVGHMRHRTSPRAQYTEAVRQPSRSHNQESAGQFRFTFTGTMIDRLEIERPVSVSANKNLWMRAIRASETATKTYLVLRCVPLLA